MEVKTLYTFKGGVGKTITSISLAEGYANKGYKVLVLDIDPQTNLTNYFISDGKAQATLNDILFEPGKAHTAITKTEHEKIDIIAGDIRLIMANDQLTISKGLKHLKLKQIIDTLKNDYDVCIIDCPPHFSELVVNALYISDDVIIPFRSDENSLYAFNTVRNTIDDFNKEYQTHISYKGLFAGMQRNNEDRRIYNEYLDKGLIYESTIRFQGKPVIDAIKEKKSLLDMKKGISEDYNSFINEYVGGKY